MARGGLKNFTVNFKGREESLEKVFGSKPIAVTQMTKNLWKVIKKHSLMKKGK